MTAVKPRKLLRAFLLFLTAAPSPTWKGAAVCHVGENNGSFEKGNQRMTAKFYSYE
ncbi:hypothetical protein B4113_2615 [Geobacillus sp. B4113_201601]|nr:hypothetical protein B4113_2615 [Geobacillus sp. B4113_201601]